MNHPSPSLCSRRHLLHAGGFSLAGLGLATLLERDGLLAAPVKPLTAGEEHFDLLPKAPPRPARAKAMISLFMMGGPSQMDLFDPKPMLAKYDGQTFPGEIKYDNLAQASAKVLGPGWKFAPRGNCGMELSDLLPHLAGVCDDITLIRSMHSGVNNHGSWLCYGLGSETDNLPAYMVLAHPGGLPTFQGEHYTNGWLPSLYQGTLVRPGEPRILNLDPAPLLRGSPQSRQLALLEKLNDDHAREHPGEHDLQARIASYALAARMQTAAKEALDISSEPPHVRALYGVDNPATADYATRCLIARRLVERGVRYVQVLNAGQSWDHHGGIKSALPASCLAVDQPSAACAPKRRRPGEVGTRPQHLRLCAVGGRRGIQGGLHLRRDRRVEPQGGEGHRPSLRLARHAPRPLRLRPQAACLQARGARRLPHRRPRRAGRGRHPDLSRGRRLGDEGLIRPGPRRTCYASAPPKEPP